MAMIDYGAVVKKNGKIISDPKELFQNFTNLKYEKKEVMKTTEDGVEYTDFETVVDETVIQTIDYDGEIRERSMAGNYFALIGDEEMMIGFYKTWFKIAVDKKEVSIGEYFCKWQSEDLKRDFVYEYPKLGKLTIKKIDKRPKYCNVYIASFSYKGDSYSVMFGYGVDPSIDYTFGSRNYYAPQKPDKSKLKRAHKYWIGYQDWNYSKSKCRKYRRTLNRMREWYKKGLEK